MVISLGLLAGLDEFPNVIMPDGESDEDSRLEASLELLGRVLRLSAEHLKEINDGAKKEVGSVKHIYSHINAMFYSRLLDLPGEKTPPRVHSDWRARARWVDEVEVDDANISTGHVKVWTLVNSEAKAGSTKKKTESIRGAPAKQKKKVVKEEEKGQMKLSFTKSVSVKKQEETGTEVVESESIVQVKEITVHDGVHDEVPVTSPRKKRRIDISSDEE